MHTRTEPQRQSRTHRRAGGVAPIAAIVLLLLFGFTALAIDVGYLKLSHTQMQAASDSSSLAGGTELMPGLGRFATKTPSEVEAAARPVAQTFAGFNRAADLNSVYVDQGRDLQFGQAIFDTNSGSWIQTLGVTPYNMVRSTVRRDQAGSTAGDGPIPLIFARAMGRDESTLTAPSAAALFPANGFTVSEDGDGASGVIPFAFKQRVWRRLEDAQNWYRNPDGTTNVIPTTYTPGDPNYPMHHPADGSPAEPMFHRHAYDNQGDLLYDTDGNPIWEQDIFDNFHADPAESTDPATVTGSESSPIPDGWLEVDLYPESTGGAITAGNAGTVDLGGADNAASAIRDQILYGLTYSDYVAMENQGILTDGELVLDPVENIEVEVDGDTGISGGPIDQAMNAIIGETRAITLYDHNVVEGPGDTVTYTLTEFVGVRILFADLTGSDKHIWIQMAPHVDGTAVPDTDVVPGPDTTIFSPLILIE